LAFGSRKNEPKYHNKTCKKNPPPRPHAGVPAVKLTAPSEQPPSENETLNVIKEKKSGPWTAKRVKVKEKPKGHEQPPNPKPYKLGRSSTVEAPSGKGGQKSEKFTSLKNRGRGGLGRRCGISKITKKKGAQCKATAGGGGLNRGRNLGQGRPRAEKILG